MQKSSYKAIEKAKTKYFKTNLENSKNSEETCEFRSKLPNKKTDNNHNNVEAGNENITGNKKRIKCI